MSASKPAPTVAPPLGFATKLSYGLGSISYGVAYVILSSAVLQIYFNQVLGIPAVWVGAAILVSLLIDLVMDPLIGQWSDNLRSRWGRRHPFMYAAAVPAAALSYLLWNAPKGLPPSEMLALAVITMVALRVAVASYEIPSAALAPELAPDYDQRTSLMAYRWFFAFGSIAVMQLVLYVVFLRQDAANPLGALNPERYGQFGALAAVVIVVCILASTAATHGRIRFLHVPPARKQTARETFRQIASTFTNPALVVVMGSSVLGGTGVGISTTLANYFYLHLWGLKSQEIGPLAAGGLLSSVVGVFVAPYLAKRFGKKQAMIALFSTSVFTSMLPISARLLGVMPPNGSKLLYVLLFTDVVVTAVLGLIGFVIISSMVADVAEDQAVKSGARSEGVLFAANGLVSKFTLGMGAFVAGALISAVHFPVHAIPGTVDPQIVRNLAMLYLPCVVIFNGGSVVVLQFYRIDRAAHEANVAKLRAAAGHLAPGEGAADS